MKVDGTLKFTVEAEGSELGKKRAEGDYVVSVLGATMPLKFDVALAKDDAAVSLGLGGITTVRFLHIYAVFADGSVANADVEFILNDGGGAQTITGTEIMVANTDITSISLTNNSHDTTGSAATIFVDIVGD